MTLASPDVVGELVGVRAWRQVRGLLWSLYRPIVWLPGHAVRAECLTAQPAGAFSLTSPPGHLAPHLGCRCGLYAAFYGPQVASEGDTPEQVFESLLGLPRASQEGLVLGEVTGWGTTEVYTRGFRCEYAAIRSIYDTTPEAGELAAAYDVPLVAL